MRTFVFTLLAIAAGAVVEHILVHLTYGETKYMHGMEVVLMFVLPVIITAGFARAMRVWNWYAVFLAILSPFLSWISMALFGVFVLHEPFYV
jgi:hypothetical protein